MGKKAFSLLLFIGMYLGTFSQSEYKTGTKNPDGYTSIYKTIYIPATSIYSSSTSITRYGLMDEKTKKIILPLKYNSVYTSYEDNIYIVQDTLEKYGLFSAKTGKMILEPKYTRVEAFSEGLAVVQQKVENSYDYIYGAVDKTGNMVIPVEYKFLGNLRDGLMNFKSGEDKFGFIDKQKKIVIPAEYKNMSTFSSGLAPACKTDAYLYGYINKENKFVIEPKYVDAEIFYNGYAHVYSFKASYRDSKKDEIILIDTRGDEINKTPYDYISMRKDGGVFVVKKGDQCGLMDSTGNLLLPVDNKTIDEFYYGKARVEKTSGMYGLINTKGKFLLPPDYNEVFMLYSGGGYYAKKDGKYVVFDKNMKVIIPSDTAKRVVICKTNIAYVYNNKVKLFDVTGKLIKTIKQDDVDIYGTGFFSNDDSLKVPYFRSITLNNLQARSNIKLDYTDITDFNEEGVFVGKNYKYYFCDYTGKRLYKQSFENVVNFSEGICGLQETSYSTPYLADKSLNKIADLTTVFYGPYSEGLAMSKSQYGGSVSYLDKTGKVTFTVYASEGYACKYGRIMIKDGSNKYYYVDRTGKAINNFTYDILGAFSDGIAGFKNNGKFGYIDTSGKMAINPQFDEAGSFTNGTGIVKSGNDYFQIDKKGNPKTPDKYIGAADPGNGTFPVKKATGFGLIDSKGKKIVEFKYQEVATMSENRIWAKKSEKWGLLDDKGIEITSFEYDGVTPFENGYAKVSKKDKIGLVDKTGTLALPLEYSNLSKVYNNMIITVQPSGVKTFPVK